MLTKGLNTTRLGTPVQRARMVDLFCQWTLESARCTLKS